jgi:hypothetical protein
MADVNVTFAAVDAGLSTALANVRANVGGAGGAASTAGAQFNQFNQTINNTTINLRTLSSNLNTAGGAARSMGINFEALIERMAIRMGIMLAVREAIRAVTETIKECLSAEEAFIHVQNINNTTGEASQKMWKNLQQIAFATGQDLEKTVIPAFIKLREDGFNRTEAEQYTRVISAALTETGINITDVIAKANTLSASFADVAKYAAAVGDVDLGKIAQSWIAAEQALKAYNKELERTHQLQQRAIDDAEKQSQAHEQFAKSTGLASGAFQAFLDAQTTIGPGKTIGLPLTAMIPDSLAKLPGGERAFSSLLGELEKKFAAGMQQISKEEGLSMDLVKAGVMGKLPGFGEQDLLAAQKRAAEETKIAETRAKEDQQYAQTQAFEQARLQMNQQITTEMGNQTKILGQLAKDSDNFSIQWKRALQGVKKEMQELGDVVRDTAKLIQQPSMGNLGQLGKDVTQSDIARMLGTIGMVAGVPNLALTLSQAIVRGVLDAMTQANKAEGKDNPVVKKLDDFMHMLQGH